MFTNIEWIVLVFDNCLFKSFLSLKKALYCIALKNLSIKNQNFPVSAT